MSARRTRTGCRRVVARRVLLASLLRRGLHACQARASSGPQSGPARAVRGLSFVRCAPAKCARRPGHNTTRGPRHHVKPCDVCRLSPLGPQHAPCDNSASPYIQRSVTFCGMAGTQTLADKDVMIHCFFNNTALGDWDSCIEVALHYIPLHYNTLHSSHYPLVHGGRVAVTLHSSQSFTVHCITCSFIEVGSRSSIRRAFVAPRRRVGGPLLLIFSRVAARAVRGLARDAAARAACDPIGVPTTRRDPVVVCARWGARARARWLCVLLCDVVERARQHALGARRRVGLQPQLRRPHDVQPEDLPAGRAAGASKVVVAPSRAVLGLSSFARPRRDVCRHTYLSTTAGGRCETNCADTRIVTAEGNC